MEDRWIPESWRDRDGKPLPGIIWCDGERPASLEDYQEIEYLESDEEWLETCKRDVLAVGDLDFTGIIAVLPLDRDNRE